MHRLIDYLNFDMNVSHNSTKIKPCELSLTLPLFLSTFRFLLASTARAGLSVPSALSAGHAAPGSVSVAPKSGCFPE